MVVLSYEERQEARRWRDEKVREHCLEDKHPKWCIEAIGRLLKAKNNDGRCC